MVLLPQKDFTKPEGSAGLITVGCGTDNQGNSFLVDRLMTTKYPLGVILIELCHQMSLRQASLRAQWIPREQNEEADSLTNSDFRHFTPGRRIPVDLAKMPFGVLHGLLSKGEAYLAEVAVAKAAGQDLPGERRKKKIKGETLSTRQPWG